MSLKMVLTRNKSTDKSTIGQLEVNGIFQCFTLEDVVRDKKIYAQTAIPAGTYEVVISYSNRFKRMLPLLLNVPNFAGVRIHSGNTAEDTEGCILVGNKKGTDTVLESRAAFNALFAKLKAEKSKIFIEII